MKLGSGIAAICVVLVLAFGFALMTRSAGVCGPRGRACPAEHASAVDPVTAGKGAMLNYWMTHTASTASPLTPCAFDAAQEGVYQRGVARSRELGVEPGKMAIGEMLDIIDACYPDKCPLDPDTDVAALSACPSETQVPG